MSAVSTLGTRMRQARTAAGLSLEDVARELGVTRTSISEWELNKKFPRMDHLPELRRILFVSLDHLVCGDIRPDVARYYMGVKEPDVEYIAPPDLKTALRANAMRGLFVGLPAAQQDALIELMKTMREGAIVE